VHRCGETYAGRPLAAIMSERECPHFGQR
jgi:hypothetical protein